MTNKKVLVEKINLMQCNNDDNIALYKILGENKKTIFICQSCFDKLNKEYDVSYIRNVDLTIKKKFKTKSFVETNNKSTWISLIPPRKFSRFIKGELRTALEKNNDTETSYKIIDDLEKQVYDNALKQREHKKLQLFCSFEEAKHLGKDCIYSTSYEKLNAKEYNDLFFTFTVLGVPLFIANKSGKILEYYPQI